MRWFLPFALLTGALLFCMCQMAKAETAQNVQFSMSAAEASPEGYRDFTGHPFVRRTARGLRDEVHRGRLEALAKRTDAALETLVPFAIKKLREAAPEYELVAGEYQTAWEMRYRGYVSREIMGRHQGDHKPLVQFLVDLYQLSKAAIGLPATQALHISDLATISWALPVVFRPTSFGTPGQAEPLIQDYRDHFAKDSGADGLYGLSAVLTWWTIEVACLAGTSGIGSMFCGAAAMAGQYIMGKWIGPKLSDWIYHMAGGL